MDRVWDRGEIDINIWRLLLDLPSFDLCVQVAGGEDGWNSDFEVGDGTP